MENNILLFATILCGCCGAVSFVGHTKQMKKLAIILWCLSVLFIVIAISFMISYLISSRFEYLYVYNHSSLDTRLLYKISALWSGQEGSFLLWTLLLGVMGFFVLNMRGKWVLKSFGIYATISFFILLMCYITNPFSKTDFLPLDGLGLNEALKNPWMVLHPPTVFVAYSALAILFSLLPALKYYNNSFIIRRLIASWLRISWCFLGIGILSGSIWAYRALGWGGYWAWDPIENAALVPWLILCSFLHLKNRNYKSVCIIPFASACLGVFLARSGILKSESIHAYTDGNRIISGILMIFLMGVLLFLVYSRLQKNKRSNENSDLKRLKNKMIFYSLNGYATLILLGTITPIFLGFDTPILFYNVISIIFVCFYCLALLLVDLNSLKKRNILMIMVSTLFVLSFIMNYGYATLGWLMLLWLCTMPLSLWIVSSVHSHHKNYYFSHLGALLLIIGTISSSSLGKEEYVLISTKVPNFVSIEGKNISFEEISTNDLLIKSYLTQDILIQSSAITRTQNNLVIPYTTKPLILLFWIGGFMIILGPCMNALSRKIHSR